MSRVIGLAHGLTGVHNCCVNTAPRGGAQARVHHRQDRLTLRAPELMHVQLDRHDHRVYGRLRRQPAV